MNVLIFSVFLACASALSIPSGYYGYPIHSQYHAQDAYGQAAHGYAYPGQAASNYRDAFGNQVGSYAYVGPEGEEVSVSYVADAHGFRVLSNNLPIAPEDTPEVAAAKIKHAKLMKEALANKAAEPVSRTKRQSTSYPAAVSYAVPYAMTTLNTVVAEADLHAKTPASTTKFDLKEKSFNVAIPLPYYTAYAYSYPFAAGFSAPAAAPVVAAVAAKNSRNKRQLVALPAPTQQFFDDLKYKSVDLNQNGMPDIPVYPVYPAQAIPYMPYTYSTVYPAAYTFTN